MSIVIGIVQHLVSCFSIVLSSALTHGFIEVTQCILLALLFQFRSIWLSWSGCWLHLEVCWWDCCGYWLLLFAFMIVFHREGSATILTTFSIHFIICSECWRIVQENLCFLICNHQILLLFSQVLSQGEWAQVFWVQVNFPKTIFYHLFLYLLILDYQILTPKKNSYSTYFYSYLLWIELLYFSGRFLVSIF